MFHEQYDFQHHRYLEFILNILKYHDKTVSSLSLCAGDDFKSLLNWTFISFENIHDPVELSTNRVQFELANCDARGK